DRARRRLRRGPRLRDRRDPRDRLRAPRALARAEGAAARRRDGGPLGRPPRAPPLRGVALLLPAARPAPPPLPLRRAARPARPARARARAVAALGGAAHRLVPREPRLLPLGAEREGLPARGLPRVEAPARVARPLLAAEVGSQRAPRLLRSERAAGLPAPADLPRARRARGALALRPPRGRGGLPRRGAALPPVLLRAAPRRRAHPARPGRRDRADAAPRPRGRGAAARRGRPPRRRAAPARAHRARGRPHARGGPALPLPLPRRPRPPRGRRDRGRGGAARGAPLALRRPGARSGRPAAEPARALARPRDLARREPHPRRGARRRRRRRGAPRRASRGPGRGRPCGRARTPRRGRRARPRARPRPPPRLERRRLRPAHLGPALRRAPPAPGPIAEPLSFQIDPGFTRQSRASLTGRMVLDGIPLVRDAVRLEDYRLETVARALLGRGKRIDREAPDAAAEIERMWRE